MKKLLGMVSAALMCAASVVSTPVAQAQEQPNQCGENLILLIRGSGELPQGKQPDTLTYQQHGDDLFAVPFKQDPTGGGRLGKGAVKYAQDNYKVAALTYPASPIKFKGGVIPSIDFFHVSETAGAAQLGKALEHIYAPCGDNPPHLTLMGYSQGADVINTAVAQGDPNMDKVDKVILLADPSRRPYGPENDNAFVHMAPTNTVGGVSRVVTSGVQYDLVLPELDKYRDAHPKKFSSYCVPGDLVCDTRSAEPTRGVTLHIVYDNLLARCDAAGGEYAQILDCIYAEAMGTKAQPAKAMLGPGWLNVTVSRSLRDEKISQPLSAQVGQRSYHSSISAGGSGSASILVGVDRPHDDNLTIDFAGQQVASIPAHYDPLYPESYSAVYVQPPNENTKALPKPLKDDLINWNTPLQQRLDLIGTVLGAPAAQAIKMWFALMYRFGWDPAHQQQLHEFFGQSVPVHPIAPPMFNLDPLALLNTMAATS